MTPTPPPIPQQGKEAAPATPGPPKPGSANPAPAPPAPPAPAATAPAPAPVPPKKPKKSSATPFIIIAGIGIGALLLAALVAVILYFFVFHKPDKIKETVEESPETEIVGVDEEDFDDNEVIVHEEAAPAPNALPQGAYTASGFLSDLPCSLDFDVDSQGNVTGTFWNILYDIKLPIGGTIDPDGTLALDLGSGSTLSHLALIAEPGTSRFRGVWGKNKKPIDIDVSSGARDTSLPSQTGVKFTIKGGGMTTHGHISPGYGEDRYLLRFDNQPAANALQCSLSGSYFNIYDTDGNRELAYFYLPGESLYDSGSATLFITNGKEFEITLGN